MGMCKKMKADSNGKLPSAAGSPGFFSRSSSFAGGPSLLRFPEDIPVSLQVSTVDKTPQDLIREHTQDLYFDFVHTLQIFQCVAARWQF